MTSDERSRRIAAAVPLGFAALLGIVWLVLALGFPESREPTDPGTSALPTVVSIAMIVIAVVALFRRPEGDVLPTGRSVLRLLLAVLALVVYALVFEDLGFVLATITFLVLALRIAGVTSAWALAAVPIVGSVALYIVFDELLRVALPPGLLGEVIS